MLQSTARISVYWRAAATNWRNSGNDLAQEWFVEKQGWEENGMV
jgi:hypothetical protein